MSKLIKGKKEALILRHNEVRNIKASLFMII